MSRWLTITFTLFSFSFSWGQSKYVEDLDAGLKISKQSFSKYIYLDNGKNSVFHGYLNGDVFYLLKTNKLTGISKLDKITAEGIPDTWTLDKPCILSDRLWFKVSSRTRDKFKLRMVPVAEGRINWNEGVDVFSISNIDKKDEVELQHDVSDNGRNVLFFLKHTKKKGELERMEFRLYDADMLEVWMKEHYSYNKKRKRSENQVVVTNYREAFLVQRSYYKRFNKCFALVVSPNRNKVKEISLHMDGISPRDFEFRTDEQQNVIITGYYTENQLTRNPVDHGVFLYKVMDGDQRVLKAYSKFPNGTCLPEKGGLVLRNAALNKNGDILLTGTFKNCVDQLVCKSYTGKVGNSVVILSSFSDGAAPGVSECDILNSMDPEEMVSVYDKKHPFILYREKEGDVIMLKMQRYSKTGKRLKTYHLSEVNEAQHILLSKCVVLNNGIMIPVITNESDLNWKMVSVTE